jgi:hypothetical protein
MNEGFDIDLNESWLNIYSDNKKICLRKVKCKINTEGGYTFELNLAYTLLSTYYEGILLFFIWLVILWMIF